MKARACPIPFRLFDGQDRQHLAAPGASPALSPSIHFSLATQFRAAYALPLPLGRVMRRRVRQLFLEESSHVFIA